MPAGLTTLETSLPALSRLVGIGLVGIGLVGIGPGHHHGECAVVL